MKKNLSDLLREEISKETPETEVTTPAKTSRSRKPTTPETEAKTEPAPLENQLTALTLELEKQTDLFKKLQGKNQHLETENIQLAEQLKQSKNVTEKQLEQEKKLKSELKKQQELVEILSVQLTEAQSKLEDQKILVEKLYAEVLEKQEDRSRLDLPSSAPEPEPEPEPEAEAEPAPAPAIVKRESAKMQYRHIVRPVAPNTSAKTLANDVLGWFD